MITFKRLTLDNTGPIRQAEIPLNKQGFVLIVGKNEVTGGSNGACKSLPWDMLNYAIDGTTTKRLKVDALINRHHPGRGVFIGLDFRKDGHEYSIQRARKSPKYGTGVTVLRDSQDISHKSIKRAEQQIRDIIGLSQQEFYNTTYLSGNYVHLLVSGTPAEKDFYLTQLFQLDVFDRMLKMVKDDLDDLRVEIGEKQENVYKYKALKAELKEMPKPDPEAITTLSSEIKTLEKNLSRFEKKYKRLLRAAEKYAQRKKVQARLDELRLDSDKSVEDVEKALGKAEDSLSKYEKAEVWERQRRSLMKKLKELPDSKDPIKAIKERIDSLDTKQRKYERLLGDAEVGSDLRHKLRRVSRDLARSSHKDASRLGDGRSINKQLVRCESQASDLNRRIQKLQSVGEGACPTCGTEIKDVRGLVSHLKEKAERLERRERSLAKALKEVEALEELRKKITDYESRLKDLPKEDPEALSKKARKLGKLVAALRDELRNAEARVSLEEQLKEIPHSSGKIPDLDDLRSSIKKMRAELSDLRKAEELRKTLRDLPESAPSHGKTRKFEKKIKATQDRIFKLRQKIADLKESDREYSDKQKEYKALKESLVKIRKKKMEEDALGALVTAFGRKGLRMRALKRIISVITDALPLYVRMLFNETKMKIKVTEKEDSFDLELYRGRDQIPLNALSRGEKAKLSLALLLTTRRATPAAKHTNILVIDEVLDSIDTYGYDGVIQTVRHLLDHSGVSSCFLISHNTDLAREKRKMFDQVWTAVKSRPDRSELIFT